MVGEAGPSAMRGSLNRLQPSPIEDLVLDPYIPDSYSPVGPMNTDVRASTPLGCVHALMSTWRLYCPWDVSSVNRPSQDPPAAT
jgi:hypothetical protein